MPGAGQPVGFAVPAAGLFAALYAALDEYHQVFVPGRWASWRDWVADTCGILIVAALLILRHRVTFLQRLLFSDLLLRL